MSIPNPSVCPSPSISGYAVCRMLERFCTRILYKKRPASSSFMTVGLLTGRKEAFTCTCRISGLMFVTFDTAALDVTWESRREFRTCRYSGSPAIVKQIRQWQE
jgi:hypothetical protein